MKKIEIKSLKSLILALTILLLSNCRYKDNDKIALLSVKNRLEKTWVLKQGISNEVDVTGSYLNEELSIKDVDKHTLYIATSSSGIFRLQNFKNKKTTIYSEMQSETLELKITKLTNKELWLEGRGIINILGASPNSVISAKYNAK
jgi:hypothetical protein